MSKRQKVLFIVPLLLLTYALVFLAGVAYAVAPTAAWILNNNLSIQWKDSGGTARDIIYTDASNQWNLCPAVASAKCTTGDTAGNILVGNGLVLIAIADAAKAGLLFLSSTTTNTLKYYDASSGLHSIAALDLAQTFSGVQTFAASGIILKGAGAGTGTFTYANSASSVTLTFPAFTDTVAVLSNTQTFTGAITMNALTLGGGMTATGQTITGGTTSGTNLGGTYNIGGTPTLTSSLTINNGIALNWSDFGLSRSSTSVMDLTSIPNTNSISLRLVGAGGFFRIFLAAADSRAAIELSTSASVPQLDFGPGGSTAADVQIARQGANAISIYTNNAASMIERIRFTGGAAQGSAGITLYEPLTLTGTQIGTYTFGGTPTVGVSLAVTGTSLNLGSASAYFATIFGNSLTFEGASAGLAGTYNIGGTPTFTASPALSSGTTLPSGGIMMFSDINSGTTLDTGSTDYCPPVGYVDSATGLGAVCTTTESNAKMTLPIKGVIKNLYITLSAAPGASKSYALTVRDNAVDTALTCTVSGAATTCSDTSHSATVTKGDDIDISAAPTGTPTGAALRISFEVDQSG